MAIGGISELAGSVCLAVCRPVVDYDNRAGSGFLRIGAAANCASLFYGAVHASVLIGLFDLRLQPHSIFGIAHDFGRCTRPCHPRLGYDSTVISSCAADIRASRTTTSRTLKLSSASSCSKLTPSHISVMPGALHKAANCSM